MRPFIRQCQEKKVTYALLRKVDMYLILVLGRFEIEYKK